MLSQIYQGYQATRPKTAAEQREIDRVNGELAAAAAGLWRARAASWHSLRQALPVGLLGAPMVVQAPPSRRMHGPCWLAGAVPGIGSAQAERTSNTMRGAGNVCN
jgi:hypothetical protein